MSTWGTPEWGTPEWGGPRHFSVSFQADGQADAAFTATHTVHGSFEADGQASAAFAAKRHVHGSFEADGQANVSFVAHNSHWHASFKAEGQAGASITGHRTLHRGFEADGAAAASFAATRRLHRGFECDGQGGAVFSSKGKIFVPAFVSSFDATPNPLLPWTVTASASIVPGCNGNGATVGNLLTAVPEFYFRMLPGTTLSGGVVGFRAKFSDFTSLGSTIATFQTLDGLVTIRLLQIGDGRFNVSLEDPFGSQLVAVIPATCTTLGLPGFVAYPGEYDYIEFAAYLVVTDTPGGGGGAPDGIAVSCTPYIRVNGKLVWTGLLVNGGNAPPNPVPDGHLYYLGLNYPDAVYDDVYANPFYNSPGTDFLGDVKADANDLTVEVLPAGPDITQVLAEMTAEQLADLFLTQVVAEGTLSKAGSPFLTQIVMEVAFARTAPNAYIRAIHPQGSFMLG